jgi:P-type Ca2+ transporter type 2C
MSGFPQMRRTDRAKFFCSARRLDNGINIFQGILKNYWFIGIQFIIVGGQVMIVNVGDAAFSVEKLNAAQWGYSVVLGLLSVPVAVFIRLIPDKLISHILSFIPRRQSSNPSFTFEDDDQVHEWIPALEEIREELTFLKRIRGGRMSELAYKFQHPAETFIPRSRSGSRSRSDSSLVQSAQGEEGVAESISVPPSTPDKGKKRGRSRSNSRFGPAAAMAGIIAGSVAGGWSPVERGQEEADSIKFSMSKLHGGLDNTDGIEIHPDTKQDDPVIVENPQKSRVPPSQNPALTPRFDHASDPDASRSHHHGHSPFHHKSSNP